MKMRLLMPALLLTVLHAAPARTQLAQEGDLVYHIDEIIESMPHSYGGGQYLQPNQASRDLWREIVDHILALEYADAHAKAQTKNYQVVLFTDTGTTPPGFHVLLERTPESTSRYWGTFVFNRAPLRPHLVVQSPHAVFDINTGFQGVRVYRHNAARAFFVSGTHRCNGLSPSPCDGTSSVCTGSSDDYRYSDMAHVVKSAFQIATETMLDQDPDLLVVQCHGFAEGAEDPDLILSNGTRTTPTDHDYVLALRDAFASLDPMLTFKIAHVDLSWTRLIATTNTQGRLINDSYDPCGSAATSSTGNFVHVEQAVVRLMTTRQDMMMLAYAIAIAVPPVTTPVAIDVLAPASAARILGNFTNPLRGGTRIEFALERTGPVTLDVYDLAGRRIARLADGSRTAGVHGAEWRAGHLASGVYFLRLTQGAEVDVRRCVLVR